MICLDTSSVIAYLQGDDGPDVEWVNQAFLDQIGVLAPVTVSELLSDPLLSTAVRETLLEIPTLDLPQGYWERAGLLRARVLRLGRRARLADTLIAQACLDNHATLVTRDHDFKNFLSSGLRVANSLD